jgi:iron complex transport system ATP-binding protein
VSRSAGVAASSCSPLRSPPVRPVATAGAIGFVGLVVPHALRRLGVRAAPLLLPASAIAGGAFVVAVDAVARTIVAPLQLPVGVLAACDRRADLHRHAAGAAGARPMSDAAALPTSTRRRRATAPPSCSRRARSRCAPAAQRATDCSSPASTCASPPASAGSSSGPNGAGKSSLLAGARRRLSVAAGSVRIDGVELADWAPSALAERRAWSPQFWSDPFPATVRETAALAHRRDAGWRGALDRRSDPDVERVLARLLLAELADSDVQTLSGGERQRVALATALLQDAPLLLLDEPASHLDLAHERLLVELLLAHAEGEGAVVASLHDLDLAWDLASHVVLIDGRGGVVAGARDDVLVADRLGAVFGVAIHAIEVAGARRFVVGPNPTERGAR